MSSGSGSPIIQVEMMLSHMAPISVRDLQAIGQGHGRYVDQLLPSRTVALLSNHVQQHRPIIFIGHSLGGLVIQKALLHSDESPDELYSDVVDSTAGVVFLGTPHRGSTLANWGGLGTDFIHIVRDVNQAIVKLLRPDSRILFQLRDSFIKLVIRRAVHRPHALKIKCYFEELGITLIGKVRIPKIFFLYPPDLSLNTHRLSPKKAPFLRAIRMLAFVQIMWRWQSSGNRMVLLIHVMRTLWKPSPS